MLELQQTCDTYTLTAGRLRLVFQFETDRWKHTVLYSDNNIWAPVLESVEGTPKEHRPASPVFQELMLQSQGADPVELQLIGQAGKNLYAAGVLFGGNLDEIDFDVSVRLGSVALLASLTSIYRLPESENGTGQNRTVQNGMGQQEADGSVIFPVSQDVQFSLQSVSTSGNPSVECRVHSPTERPILEVGCFNLAAVRPQAGGTTFRWRYRISLCNLA